MLSLAWSPDGRSSRPAARTTTCTSGASRRANDTVLPGTPLKPRALSWSSDSQLLATTDGPDVMVWNFAGEAARMPPPPVRLVGPPSLATALAFASGRHLLATGYRDGMVHVWKPRDHDQTVGVQPLDRQIESLEWGPPAGTPTDAPPLLAGGGDRLGLAGGLGGRSSRGGRIADASTPMRRAQR